MNTPLRVRAIAGRKLPAITPEGAPIPGRFVGYDRRGEILSEPVTVPADPYHLRAVKNGDLAAVS